MRNVGRISGWNDDRGFGFVTPNGGGDRAFVHVKAFGQGRRRPLEGDLVSYAPVRDAKGRLNAADVRFARAGATRGKAAPARDWSSARTVLALAFLVLLGGAWRFGRVDSLVALAFVLMSAATFVAYAIDKSAARSQRWRTPESTLHLLALLCGWPGALLAQVVLRHKSRKAGFQVVFWVTVLINCLALAWLLGGDSAARLRGL